LPAEITFSADRSNRLFDDQRLLLKDFLIDEAS